MMDENREDSKDVPSTSAHATSTQRIKVDKSSFVEIYSTLANCKFHFFTLKEGNFNDPLAFTDNYITHSFGVEQYDVVKFLMKKIKGKLSPGKNNGFGDGTEEEDQIDVDSVEFDGLLARLNSCLEDDNLEDIEKLTNGNQILKVSEDRLIVGIGKHLIRKLTGNASTSASKVEKNCPCVDSSEDKEKEPEQEPKENYSGKEADSTAEEISSKRKSEVPEEEESGKRKSCREKKLEHGNMYIGSADTWHGEIDLFALGEGMTPVKALPDTGAGDSVDGDSPDSLGENLELKVQSLEQSIQQSIQQAITFAWTEYNRHPELSPLYPTVYMNNYELSFMVYNPVTDSLLAPVDFMRLVNYGMEKTDVDRYLGIFLLWLILNHRFFFVKDLKMEGQHPCDFKAKAKNVLEKYEELNKFSSHISSKSSGVYGHISLARKRKREPN